MQGLNLIVRFWNNNYSSDDASGGAVITGTIAYSGIRVRISARRPTQSLLEQGLEVERLFDMIVNTQSLTVSERDEVEVTSPTTNPYYGEKMRIIGINHDSRLAGHTEFTLSRIERSRSRQ